MNKTKTVKKKDKKSLSLKGYFSLVHKILTILVGIISIIIMLQISYTTNLIYIQSAIQQRTDAVLSLAYELEASRLRASNPPSEREELDILIIENKHNDAIFALLHTYEFSCRQYLDRKIDRKVFQLLYRNGTLAFLLDKHKDMITKDKYPSIDKVNTMWRKASAI